MHLLIRVQHERAVLHNRLVEGLSSDNDYAYPSVHVPPISLEPKRTEPRLSCLAFLNPDFDPIALLREDDIVELLNFLFPNHHIPDQHIHEHIPAHRQRLGELPARLDSHIENPNRSICQISHRVHAMARPRNNLDIHLPVISFGMWDLFTAQIAVAWLAEFEFGRKVDPELETDARRAVFGDCRHLRMHDSAAGGHELKITGVNGAGVSGEVFMVDGASEEVSYSFLATACAVR